MKIGDLYINKDPFYDERVKILDIKPSRSCADDNIMYVRYRFVDDDIDDEDVLTLSLTVSEFLKEYTFYKKDN